MLRNSDCSAPSTTSVSLAPIGARPDVAVPAQLLHELSRPWRVIASQLLLMVEPLCTPEQRQALQRRADLLYGAARTTTDRGLRTATSDTPASGDSRRSGRDRQ